MDRNCGVPVFVGLNAVFVFGYLVKRWKLKILPTSGTLCPRSKQSQLFHAFDGIVPVVEVGAVFGFVHEVLPCLALGHGCDKLITQDAQVFECFDFGFAVIGA